MEKDIGKINKNDTTDIVIRIDDFGGRRGLTIREFVTSERYTGFTKAGVRIPVAEFLKFREMVNSIGLEEMKDDNTSKTSNLNPEKAKSSGNEELPDY